MYTIFAFSLGGTLIVDEKIVPLPMIVILHVFGILFISFLIAFIITSVERNIMSNIITVVKKYEFDSEKANMFENKDNSNRGVENVGD